MRNIDDREGKKEKITVEIVATNVVASRPPNGDRLQRRPLVPICYPRHDFDHPPHRKCNNKGLMSYGDILLDKWSTCSNNDFKNWWKKAGFACMKESTTVTKGKRRIQAGAELCQAQTS